MYVFFFLYLDFTSIASLLMASRFLEGYYSEISVCESGPSGCFLFFLGLMTLKRKEMVIKQLRCNWFYLSPCTDSFSLPLATFLLSFSCKALALTSLLQWILSFEPPHPPWLRPWNEEVVTHTQHECMWAGPKRGGSRCTQGQELRGRFSLGKWVGGKWGYEGKAGGLRASELERPKSVDLLCV